jgi:hypothetical protein
MRNETLTDNSKVTANRTLLLPVAPTGVTITPRTAGFGHRDLFGVSGKISLVPSGKIS